MRAMTGAFTAILLALVSVSGHGGEKVKKVEYDAGFTAYFVKNTYPLKEESAYVVLADKEAFDKVFGVGFTMKKPKTIDPKDFDSKIAVVVLKKGPAPWKLTVEEVTTEDGELRVHYRANPGQAGTAIFTSPLIVMVAGRDYGRVVFVENGKKAGTAELKKK